MLSLSTMKDGNHVPREEDRKKILTQMKVKTTLRSDKSWIQKKSDSEEEKNYSPLHSPLRSRKSSQRSPLSPKVLPLNHSSPRALFEELSSQAEQKSPVTSRPSKKAFSEELSSQAEQQSPEANKSSIKSHNTTASSGYLIRGVFTKTVDKNAPSNTVSNGSPKSAKSASSAPGYRMSTEDYKRLAPYNVKRDIVPDHMDPPVSPDEQQKRTEAASSVLRQTARKDRSYVLSAAKKSNGSAAREAPSFMAKRVEIEDDTGPRSRSQTMPASSWINNHGKSNTFGERRSLWSGQRMSNAASTTSIDKGSKSQSPRHSSGYSSAFSHFTSLENSNKQDQEKHIQTSWDESLPRGSVSSPKRSSEKNGGKFQPASGSEMRDAIFSEDSWEGRKALNAKMNQNSQVPHISPEDSPKRCAADQEEGTFSRYESPSSRITEDALARPQSPSCARDSTDPLPGERQPTTISSDQDIDLKGPLSSVEKKNGQEAACESPSETEYKKVDAYLAKSDSWSSEGTLSTAGTQTEHPEAARSEESEQEKARANFLPTDSSVAASERHQGEHGSDSDTSSLSRRATFGSSGNLYRMTPSLDDLVCNRSVWESGHRPSHYLNRQASYPTRTSGIPPYLSNQSCNANMLEMNHKMTPYLNSPAFSCGRSYVTSKDGLVTNSMRSHRVPFYKDICDADARRYLAQSEDRAAFTSSFSTSSAQFRIPSASGYDSDPTTSGKTLLFVKESINSTELSSSPRYNSRSLVDLSTMERQNYHNGSYLQSNPPRRHSEDLCTYCGREIRDCPKIKIEKLNLCCHEFCFRCGICHKPMGDLLDKIYIHRDIVHCDKCYEKLF